MNLRIFPQDGTPLYQQIVNQVKLLVASGRLAEGEELPSIRALAERLVINPNTVARAYRELEAAGLVEKRRTNGTFVSAVGSPLRREEKLRILAERADLLIAEARGMDISFSDLLALLHDRRAAMTAPASPPDEDEGTDLP